MHKLLYIHKVRIFLFGCLKRRMVNMAGKNTLKPNSVYLFVNRRTNLVLQAPVERGAAVTQEKPEGNKLQLWTPIPCEDGSFRFMNPATAFMLDTVYSGTAAG